MPSANIFTIPLSDQDQNEVRLRLIFEDGGRCELNYWRGANEFEKSVQQSGEIEISLGKVGDLRGGKDRWRLRLFSTADEESRMVLVLKWYESDNTKPLKTWIPDEAENGKVTVPANEFVFLSDHASYI